MKINSSREKCDDYCKKSKRISDTQKIIRRQIGLIFLKTI